MKLMDFQLKLIDFSNGIPINYPNGIGLIFKWQSFGQIWSSGGPIDSNGIGAQSQLSFLGQLRAGTGSYLCLHAIEVPFFSYYRAEKPKKCNYLLKSKGL